MLKQNGQDKDKALILITGGAGFIGSHTLVDLAAAGHDLLVLDNLCNSSQDVIQSVENIIGKSLHFIAGDIRDRTLLDSLFEKYRFQAVIHFAGLKAVGESVANPLAYYDNNVYGTQVLLQAMQQAGVFDFVFSSSATVYGDPKCVPIKEQDPTGQPTNPYGRSKLMVEQILQDLSASDERWNIALLRYFNPIGAHESGLIGENPNGIPNNLMPYITQVASGQLAQLSVFGADYPTADGTGVRDYIHVVDLAKGHVAALNYLKNHNGVHIWNLGTGQGYSVLEIVQAFEKECHVDIPYQLVARRPGDIAECYADPTKAKDELNWQAKKGLHDMMKDAWRWQQRLAQQK